METSECVTDGPKSLGWKERREMEVHFTPEIEKKLNDLATQSGRAADELVQDAMAGYLDELAGTREMFDSRYDDIKSGRVRLIPGNEVFARLREKSEDRRLKPGS
jgi:hypothetical protein